MRHGPTAQSRVVVRIRSREAKGIGEPSAWRRFVDFTKNLLTFGLWGGTRAASAKVVQMESQALKVAAEAKRTSAHASAIELQNAKRAMELLDEIVRSNDSTEVKLAKLGLVREANPKLANALDRLLARYESITSQGGSIKVVPKELSSQPASPRRPRRRPDVGMKGNVSEPPPSGIP